MEISDSYFNMKEIINHNYHLNDNVIKAMKETGVEPKIILTRGGTDGATNIFAWKIWKRIVKY